MGRGAMEKVLIERATVLPWVEVAQSSRLMSDVLSQVGDARAGSNFAQVHRLFPFELASEWCRGYLLAALEHMDMWANHVAPLKFSPDAEVISGFRPAQTLSRAAVEAASQAVWVMDGDSPQECARRHLQLVLHDLEEQRKAATADQREQLAQRRSFLLEVLQGAITEAEIGQFAGYMSTVKAASAIVAAKGDREGGLGDSAEVERLWRASAGSAHGKRWPAFELQVEVSRETMTTGHVGTMRVPDPAAITKILKLADAVLAYGVLRFADYCGYAADLGSMLAGAGHRLRAVIPRIEDAAETRDDFSSESE
jgi:hypothetical protein